MTPRTVRGPRPCSFPARRAGRGARAQPGAARRARRAAISPAGEGQQHADRTGRRTAAAWCTSRRSRSRRTRSRNRVACSARPSRRCSSGPRLLGGILNGGGEGAAAGSSSVAPRATADRRSGDAAARAIDRRGLQSGSSASRSVPAAGCAAAGIGLARQRQGSDRRSRQSRAACGDRLRRRGRPPSRRHRQSHRGRRCADASPWQFGSNADSGHAPGAVVTMNPYAAAAKFVLGRNATQRDIQKMGGRSRRRSRSTRASAASPRRNRPDEAIGHASPKRDGAASFRRPPRFRLDPPPGRSDDRYLTIRTVRCAWIRGRRTRSRCTCPRPC